MIPRAKILSQIEASFQIHPAAALLGPRQFGKTTLDATLVTNNEKEFRRVQHLKVENWTA